MNDTFETDFLTPKGGFALGVASVLNIGGNFFHYNYSATPQEADARALRSDWQIIGQDIRNAFKLHDPKQCELALEF